jgi:galactosamine-6-phosphate isomerase
MNITYFHEYEQLSETAAGLILDQIRLKPDLLLCAATGNSPIGIYSRLAALAEQEPPLFGQLRIIKLDEWAGIAHGSEGSCERYLRHHMLNPLKIDDARYISFVSDATDPIRECERIRFRLSEEGPIDIAVLGLGKNGHLGFNEPAGLLEPHCHLTPLTATSKGHDMMNHARQKPAQGMTLGIKEILSANMIILVVSGKGKGEAMSTLLSGKITTSCPASFLWLHDKVYGMIMK